MPNVSERLLTPADSVNLARMRGVDRRALARSGLVLWQERVVRWARDPRVRVVLATAPRGGGKTLVCGRLAREFLTAGGSLHERRGRALIAASSKPQAGLVLDALRREVGDAGDDWKWTGEKVAGDGGAEIRIIGSDARRAQGLGHERLVVCDEPAAWQPGTGPKLWEAILGSTGKRPDRTIVLCGTRHPATRPHWWLDLLDRPLRSSWRKVVVEARDPGRWIDVLRANRYAAATPDGEMAATLKREFLEARDDPGLARVFAEVRCNVLAEPPGLRVLDERELARVVERRPPRVDSEAAEGVVGLDMGSNRSFSAAAVLWPALKRLDVRVVAPRDAEDVPAGALRSRGSVPAVDEVLPDVGGVVVADQHRSAEVEAAAAGRGLPVRFRPAWRHNDVGEEVAALRQLLLDDGWALGDGAGLFEAAVAAAEIKPDGSWVKRGADDALRAAMIAARHLVRTTSRTPATFVSLPHRIGVAIEDLGR